MTSAQSNGHESFRAYQRRLFEAIGALDLAAVSQLGSDLKSCWQNGSQLLLCGNGGSAGNAIHLANDFLYGIAKGRLPGMRVHALSANAAVLTCLGNDLGYEAIFSEQIKVMARKGDMIGVLSGSGNSPNVVRALEAARDAGVRSFAIVGYSGGKCKALADVVIHLPIDDMQIAEDAQLIVGHMLMQWLYANPPAAING